MICRKPGAAASRKVVLSFANKRKNQRKLPLFRRSGPATKGLHAPWNPKAEVAECAGYANAVLLFALNARALCSDLKFGGCGVASPGPQLSAAKLGSEQCLPLRGKQPHERVCEANWRRSLCAAKRPRTPAGVNGSSVGAAYMPPAAYRGNPSTGKGEGCRPPLPLSCVNFHSSP